MSERKEGLKLNELKGLRRTWLRQMKKVETDYDRSGMGPLIVAAQKMRAERRKLEKRR